MTVEYLRAHRWVRADWIGVEHSEHLYDPECLLCRGDPPANLSLVVRELLNVGLATLAGAGPAH